MKVFFTVILLLSFSFNLLSQDNEDLAGVYYSKAKQSLADNDVEKVKRYLLKTKEYYGGITKEEVSVFGIKFYQKIKDKKELKNYFDAFFKINKDKQSASYKEVLVLYTDFLDSVEDSKSKKEVVKESPKENELMSSYKKANELFKNKKYDESLVSISKFFSLNPDKASSQYQEMIVLLVEVKENIAEIKSKKIPAKVIEETKKDSVVVVSPIFTEEELKEEEIAYNFLIIENSPVYPGCEDESNLKQCFSEAIRKHLIDNFDLDLVNKLQVASWEKRVFINIVVDKEGQINDANSKVPHPGIKEEVMRVISLFPKVIAATHKGNPVSVKYSVPYRLIAKRISDKKGKN